LNNTSDGDQTACRIARGQDRVELLQQAGAKLLLFVFCLLAKVLGLGRSLPGFVGFDGQSLLLGNGLGFRFFRLRLHAFGIRFGSLSLSAGGFGFGAGLGLGLSIGASLGGTFIRGLLFRCSLGLCLLLGLLLY
jgi:hypothetical protein